MDRERIGGDVEGRREKRQGAKEDVGERKRKLRGREKK